MQAQGDYMDTTDRTILRRFILGIVVILLIGVVAWVFFFREDGKKNTGTTNKGADSSQQKQGESQPQSGSVAGMSATDSRKNTSAQSDSSASGQPATLADTGPGDLVLLFVGAAAIGTLAHHLHARRHDNVRA
jgi:hypothetical protein